MKHSKLLVLLAGLTSLAGLAACGPTTTSSEVPSVPSTSDVETSEVPSTSESTSTPDSSETEENTFGEGITDAEKTILAKLAKGSFTKVDFKANGNLLAKFEVKTGDALTTIIYKVAAKTNFLTENFNVYVGVNTETFVITGIQVEGKTTTHTDGSEFNDNNLGMEGNDGSSFDAPAGSTVTAKAINDAAKEAVKAVKDELTKPVDPEPDVPERETYTVTFDLNGGTGAFAATKVEAGQVFARPATDPVKADYNFIGWFVKGTDDKYDFTQPVNSDINLVARYQSAYTFHKGEILKAPKVGKDGKIVIPATIDGEAVTTLTEELFKGNTELKEIVIPASVTEIKFSAFEGCTSLTKFSVLSSVDEKGNIIKDLKFGIKVFKGCTAIKEFVVPERITTLGTSTFEECTALKEVTFNAAMDLSNDLFSGCTSLRKVTFANEENAAIKIGQRTFKDCTSLNEFVNFETVKELGQDALAGCTSITELHFGKVFNSWNYNAIAGCVNLSKVTMDEANTKYAIVNNALYQKNSSFQLLFAFKSTDTTFTFPAKTTAYSSSAFVARTNLLEFKVEEGNTTYSARAGLLFKTVYGKKNLELIPNAFKGAIVLQGDEKYKSNLNLGKFEGVTSIQIAEAQANEFKVVNGALYSLAKKSWSDPTMIEKELLFVNRDATGTILLPTTVETIAEYAFNGSIVDGVAITYTGYKINTKDNSFLGVKDTFKIYVPAGKYNTYKSAWSSTYGGNELGLKYLVEEAYVAPAK